MQKSANGVRQVGALLRGGMSRAVTSLWLVREEQASGESPLAPPRVLLRVCGRLLIHAIFCESTAFPHRERWHEGVVCAPLQMYYALVFGAVTSSWPIRGANEKRVLHCACESMRPGHVRGLFSPCCYEFLASRLSGSLKASVSVTAGAGLL